MRCSTECFEWYCGDYLIGIPCLRPHWRDMHSILNDELFVNRNAIMPSYACIAVPLDIALKWYVETLIS